MSVVPFRKPGFSVDDYITDFILAYPRFSEGTADAYKRAIRQFDEWLAQRKWTSRVQHWVQILLQLSVFFEVRVQPHIR
ncbi:hypothetical protein [Brevibacillus dissolubilis]|uniref:hypothetical protein n=1 Tax=Brevibacillus dissolubilis TaxID=1844116 RepID=UPI0011173B08|nr:hypothetical protein [Brevibacillus dissolubilis]